MVAHSVAKSQSTCWCDALQLESHAIERSGYSRWIKFKGHCSSSIATTNEPTLAMLSVTHMVYIPSLCYSAGPMSHNGEGNDLANNICFDDRFRGMS